MREVRVRREELSAFKLHPHMLMIAHDATPRLRLCSTPERGEDGVGRRDYGLSDVKLSQAALGNVSKAWEIISHGKRKTNFYFWRGGAKERGKGG